MLNQLNDLLAPIQPGPMTDTCRLVRFLADAWDDLSGDDGGIIPQKHLKRMEEVAWNPPVLTFLIERHGAAVMGSSRDELQRWTINVANGTATCKQVGYRQDGPRQASLNVEPLAEEVAAQIASGHPDERLRRHEDGRVRVLIGKIIPARSAVKETVAGRRRRFRVMLANRLVPQGWIQVQPNVWHPPKA